MKPRIRRSIIIVLLAVITGTALMMTWHYNQPLSLVIYADSDNNGFREKYLLKQHQLKVWENSRLMWQTPKEWQVRQFLTADADNDGQIELLMVVWKKGSFGSSKPFWFKGPDNQFTCHLFVYRITAGNMKAVWCSSALVHPIVQLKVKDTNNDSRNELQIIEGPRSGWAYGLRQYFSRQPSLWVWNSWGFERAD